MKVQLRTLPVAYACAGCPEFGYAAPRVARELEVAGRVEMVWLGLPRISVTARWPVFSIDACERGCAKRWLEERGLQVQRAFVLEPLERLEPHLGAERIASGA